MTEEIKVTKQEKFELRLTKKLIRKIGKEFKQMARKLKHADDIDKFEGLFESKIDILVSEFDREYDEKIERFA